MRWADEVQRKTEKNSHAPKCEQLSREYERQGLNNKNAPPRNGTSSFGAKKWSVQKKTRVSNLKLASNPRGFVFASEWRRLVAASVRLQCLTGIFCTCARIHAYTHTYIYLSPSHKVTILRVFQHVECHGEHISFTKLIADGTLMFRRHVARNVRFQKIFHPKRCFSGDFVIRNFVQSRLCA